MTIVIIISCKKDDPVDDNGSEKPFVDNWKDAPGHYRVYTSSQKIFVITPDNVLWGRGSYFKNNSKTNENGYYKIADNVLQVVSDGLSIFYRKTDNSVWGTLRYFEYSDSTIREHLVKKITTDAKDVETGVGYIAILKNDNTVWALGRNSNGQFGDGKVSEENQSLKKIAADVLSVATGYNTTYLLKTDHTLWSSGSNNYDKLGYHAGNNSTQFKQFEQDVIKIDASYNALMYTKKDGKVWTFGANVNGSLGIGNSDQPKPGPNLVGDDAKDIESGGGTSFIIKNDHTLWVTGMGSFGLFSEDKKESELLSFFQISDRVNTVHSYTNGTQICIMRDGVWYAIGDNYHQQIQKSKEKIILKLTPMDLPK